MHFNVLPLAHVGNARGPQGLKWRFGDGIDCRWSLKDFGPDVDAAIVVTDRPIRAPRLHLKEYGIDVRWRELAPTPLERAHRLLGVAFAMQSGIDRPDLWLGRDIHFGFASLRAFDRRMQQLEQESLLPRFGDWVMRGRMWVHELTGRMVPVVAGGALPFTDAFTATDGTALTTYNSNWTYNNSGVTAQTFAINTNAVHPTTSGGPAEIAAHVNSETFNNDQYAQGTIANLASGVYIGLAVRCASGATQTFYDYISDSADASYLGKYVAGSYTQLGSAGAVFMTSLAIRLEVSGSDLRPMRAGATADIGIQTDASSPIASGFAGIAGYSGSTGARLDNFEGGNLATAAASLLSDDRRRRFQSLLVR